MVVTHIQKRTSRSPRIVISGKIIKRPMVSNIAKLDEREGFLEQMVDRKVDHALRVMRPYDETDDYCTPETG